MSCSAFCLNITLFCLQTGTKVACNKVSSKVSQQTYIEWNNDVLCWFSYCTTCSLMALPKPNYTRVENRPLGCCLLRVPVQNLWLSVFLLSCKSNSFDLKGFAPELVLKQRQKREKKERLYQRREWYNPNFLQALKLLTSVLSDIWLQLNLKQQTPALPFHVLMSLHSRRFSTSQ